MLNLFIFNLPICFKKVTTHEMCPYKTWSGFFVLKRIFKSLRAVVEFYEVFYNFFNKNFFCEGFFFRSKKYIKIIKKTQNGCSGITALNELIPMTNGQLYNLQLKPTSRQFVTFVWKKGQLTQHNFRQLNDT